MSAGRGQLGRRRPGKAAVVRTRREDVGAQARGNRLHVRRVKLLPGDEQVAVVILAYARTAGIRRVVADRRLQVGRGAARDGDAVPLRHVVRAVVPDLRRNDVAGIVHVRHHVGHDVQPVGVVVVGKQRGDVERTDSIAAECVRRVQLRRRGPGRTVVRGRLHVCVLGDVGADFPRQGDLTRHFGGRDVVGREARARADRRNRGGERRPVARRDVAVAQRVAGGNREDVDGAVLADRNRRPLADSEHGLAVGVVEDARTMVGVLGDLGRNAAGAGVMAADNRRSARRVGVDVAVAGAVREYVHTRLHEVRVDPVPCVGREIVVVVAHVPVVERGARGRGRIHPQHVHAVSRRVLDHSQYRTVGPPVICGAADRVNCADVDSKRHFASRRRAGSEYGTGRRPAVLRQDRNRAQVAGGKEQRRQQHD